MREDVRDIIVKYGSDILCSDIFQETFGQTHHHTTSVGEHTLGVAAEGVRFCISHGLTDEKTLNNVVTSCLCHDLGIMGRDEKFKNSLDTLIWPPRHSAEVYMDMTGEDNERVLDSIRCHMFPLRMCIPRYKESWILVMADKIGASREKLKKPVVTSEEKDELLALAREEIRSNNREEQEYTEYKEL